jgi:hypothetical protein
MKKDAPKLELFYAMRVRCANEYGCFGAALPHQYTHKIALIWSWSVSFDTIQ